MEQEAAQFGVQPFSYDILDEEAAKISTLVLAVNQKCAGNQADAVARDLFNWAEEMHQCNRPHEAEFLYLHAINIWQRHHELPYPITFTTLRDYAKRLLTESNTKLDNIAPIIPPMESNAA